MEEKKFIRKEDLKMRNSPPNTFGQSKNNPPNLFSKLKPVHPSLKKNGSVIFSSIKGLRIKYLES